MKKIRGGDILLGIGLTLFVACLFFIPLNFFETAHGKLYDLSLKIRGSLIPPPDLTIVAIDDASIAQIGRWPWPRTKITDLINRLSEAGAKIIAVDIVFFPCKGKEVSRAIKCSEKPPAELEMSFFHFILRWENPKKE